MDFVKNLNCTQTSPVQETIWNGDERIVIAFDCGTTFSGVAYSYLYPNGQVFVQRVLHWPGQDSQKGEAKIPTLVWYDEKGQAQAFGSEAYAPMIRARAASENWQLAEHFKLHLHPSTMRTKHNIIVQPLPQGISIEQIYADFFRYLYESTRTFFLNREVDGADVWNRLKDRIEFVIPCPNGWSAWEFGLLRKAAIQSGMVWPSESSWRIHFVSEAEASVHYLLSHGELEGRLISNDCFIVCDAGGSTVDSTHYSVTSTTPVLKLKETQASACVQAGAIFVDQVAASYFNKLFSSAGIQGHELDSYTRTTVESFEAGAKKAFRDTRQDDFRIETGDHRFTNASIGVRRGILHLNSAKMERFFSPLVKQIKESVKEQLKGYTTQYVLLVGGFGDSPYLRKQFMESRAFRDTEIICANDSTAKVVAEGAVTWYIQHAVVARAPRFSYGVETNPPHSLLNFRHLGRPVDASDRIHHVWKNIVVKGQVVQEDEEKIYDVIGSFPYTDNVEGRIIMTPIYVNTAGNADKQPYFFRDRRGNLLPNIHQACVLKVDISKTAGALTKEVDEEGKGWWALPCQVGVKFGGSEITAQVIWKDADGKEHRGEAVVLPEKF